MKMIKELFKSVGLIVLGVLSLIMLMLMAVLGVFKLLGRFVAYSINMRIAEKWHKNELKEDA